MRRLSALAIDEGTLSWGSVHRLECGRVLGGITGSGQAVLPLEERGDAVHPSGSPRSMSLAGTFVAV